MRKRTLLSMAAVSLVLAVPALADGGGHGHGHGHGCKMKDVAGSYTRLSQFDTGSGSQNYLFQLNLGSDGTAYQYWTGLPELMNTLGSGSPNVGSWKCEDGRVLLNWILATYIPVEATNPFNGDPELDITLLRHSRVTYLFDVVDDDTLVRVEAVARIYGPTEDPTDPNAGTLGTVSTVELQYDRLVPSDADLNP